MAKSRDYDPILAGVRNVSYTALFRCTWFLSSPAYRKPKRTKSGEWEWSESL